MALSNADKDIISRAIKEFDASLTRQAAERELQKGICEKLKDTCELDPKVTRKLAKLYYAQNRQEVETEFDDVIGIYDSCIEVAPTV